MNSEAMFEAHNQEPQDSLKDSIPALSQNGPHNQNGRYDQSRNENMCQRAEKRFDEENRVRGRQSADTTQYTPQTEKRKHTQSKTCANMDDSQ